MIGRVTNASEGLLGSAPTVGSSGKRIWLYPDRRPGPRARIRKKLALLLMLFYLMAPWLSIDGLPFFRLDVLDRVAYLWGSTFPISDISNVVFVFLFLAFLLFLVTALFGRLWCGYACPQTVFVEWLIRPVEELIEGPAHHRRIADRGPWTPKLIAKKLLKHCIFLLVALVVANTFLAYFVDPQKIIHWMISPPSEHVLAFSTVAIVMVGFYLDLVWFREQFCSFLCPYARLQTVLMDSDSPGIAYDGMRGEPRGRPSKLEAKKVGDCIDCGLCVRVCPTGIDIRKGPQLECIMCGRCADACDMIMASLHRPLGLIRLASQKQLDGKKNNVFRPRIVLYALLLGTALGALILAIADRDALAVVITRAAGTSLTRLPDGRQMNAFNARVTNTTGESQAAELQLLSERLTLICTQCATPLAPHSERVMALFVVEKDGGGAKLLDHVDLAISATEKKITLPLIWSQTPDKR